jgi:hypothetical protein
MAAHGLDPIMSVTDSSWQVAPVRDDHSSTLFAAFLARRGRAMYTKLLQKMDYAGVVFAR